MSKIQQAIEQLKQGKFIIITDHEKRENEGDLVFAAQFSTPDKIHFMAQHGRGLICLAMAPLLIEKLQLPMMAENNESSWYTPFTISIDARYGIHSGISASDRSHTIQLALNEPALPNDFVQPGHVFPLKAKPYGVLQREGHTEASVDLANLAGLKSAAVICEILADNGEMLRGEALNNFATKWHIPIVSIEEIKNYRLQHENILEVKAQAKLPTHQFGHWQIYLFYNPARNEEYTVLTTDNISTQTRPLVRIHSSCFTGDILGSMRCDCGWQLQQALSEIQQKGGMLIYLQQEGRGIGLANKILAYALQEQGHDTISANHQLGFETDLRDYDFCGQILQHFGFKNLSLLTNNPQKITALTNLGLNVKRQALITEPNQHNSNYLLTKKNLPHHLLLNFKE